MNVDVALYLPSLGGGGAERVTVTLANGLAERGLSVDLVLVSAKGPHLVNVSPKVRIVDLNAGRVLLSLLPLVGYLRRTHPKAMLSALGHANIIAVIARKLAMIDFTLLVAEHTNVAASRSETRLLMSKVVYSLRGWAYLRADKVLAVSRGVANDLITLYSLPPDHVITVYNPVITSELMVRSKESLDCAWFREGESPVILSVGRMIPAKDYSTLIRAFAKVREYVECRLVILGDGELRQDIEGLISDLELNEYVMLPGFVENPYAWMSRSSLFVLSSYREGLPTVLIEAMACGSPVISTDCPSGPSEILEGGKWGELVAIGDVSGLAKKMLEVLNSSTKINVSPRLEAFTADTIIEEYKKVLLPKLEKKD